jgi:hypothetical protein
MVAIGPLPEHAPDWSRRPAATAAAAGVGAADVAVASRS